MKKIILTALLLVIVLGGGVIYYVLNSLDTLVKQQVELHAGNALQTKVGVGNVTIKLLDGFAEISGFQVANPEGFSQNDALKFSAVRLDIDTKDLSKMPVVIEEITINSLATLFELNAAGQSNYNELLKNVKSASSSEPAPEPTPSESETASDVRISLKKLTIKDTAMAIDLTALGDKNYEETLPTLQVENIGGAQGVPPAKLGVEVANAVLKILTKEARRKQEDKLKDKAIEKLKEKAGDKLQGLMDKLGS